MSTVPQLSRAAVAADLSGARVLDVREPAEVVSGRIAGGTDIALSQLPARVSGLDPATPLATVCRRGRRGQAAAEMLVGAGFTVANLAGGLDRWTAEGRPTV